jgi:hypothetical protein
MDKKNILSALVEIEGVLEKVEEAKGQLQAEIDNSSRGGYELPRDAMVQFLDEAAVQLGVVLDIVSLAGTHAELTARWKSFSREDLGKTQYFPEVDYLESKPLNYLQNVIRGIRLGLGNKTESFETYELLKLERLLRNTAVLVHKQGVNPQSESGIQRVMHDYLDAYFTQYTRNVQIPGTLKNFKPDGGIINLQAAIEFKFADNESEVVRALSGIFEDVSGYSGSADWTRFYSVVYQTNAFVAEDRFRADFEKAAAKNWTTILVNGSGARHPKSGKPEAPK